MNLTSKIETVTGLTAAEEPVLEKAVRLAEGLLDRPAAKLRDGSLLTAQAVIDAAGPGKAPFHYGLVLGLAVALAAEERGD